MAIVYNKLLALPNIEIRLEPDYRMTHFSGMAPDVDLKTPWTGYDTGIKLAANDKPTGPPLTRMVYSDINFELLGEIVARVSAQSQLSPRYRLWEPSALRSISATRWLCAPPCKMRSTRRR